MKWITLIIFSLCRHWAHIYCTVCTYVCIYVTDSKTVHITLRKINTQKHLSESPSRDSEKSVYSMPLLLSLLSSTNGLWTDFCSRVEHCKLPQQSPLFTHSAICTYRGPSMFWPWVWNIMMNVLIKSNAPISWDEDKVSAQMTNPNSIIILLRSTENHLETWSDQSCHLTVCTGLRITKWHFDKSLPTPAVIISVFTSMQLYQIHSFTK